MGFCVDCLDVTTSMSNDHSQLDCLCLSMGVELEMRLCSTLVMYDCPSWYFDLSRRVNVAGRRLEEKERVFWDGITQFACVFRIVSANSHYFFARACKRSHISGDADGQVTQRSAIGWSPPLGMDKLHTSPFASNSLLSPDPKGKRGPPPTYGWWDALPIVAGPNDQR